MSHEWASIQNVLSIDAYMHGIVYSGGISIMNKTLDNILWKIQKLLEECGFRTEGIWILGA